MKVFKYIQDQNKKEFVEYPRHDMGIIDGLDPNIKYYLTVDDVKPEYDADTQDLIYSEEFTGEMHPDYPALNLARGRWNVVIKELPLLEQIQSDLKLELKDVILEMSNIVTAVKNLYYDALTDTYNLPQDFKQLVGTIQQVRKRVLKDIDAFTDSKQAIKFKIRTEEAEGLLTQLKSYL